MLPAAIALEAQPADYAFPGQAQRRLPASEPDPFIVRSVVFRGVLSFESRLTGYPSPPDVNSLGYRLALKQQSRIVRSRVEQVAKTVDFAEDEARHCQRSRADAVIALLKAHDGSV